MARLKIWIAAVMAVPALASMWSAPAAQSRPGLAYDHVHMAAPNSGQAVQWYIDHLDGQHGESEIHVRFKTGGPMEVEFPFNETANPKPSDGGGVDNIGFSYADVDAKVRQLEGQGVTIVERPRQIPGLWKQAVIRDPWGARIELVEDAERLGLHHVSLRVPDPEMSLKFYVDVFGGRRMKVKQQLDAIDYGNVYLLIGKGPGGSNVGRAIDHIGWAPLGKVEEAVAWFKGKGVKFESELPNTLNARQHRTFYLVDPSGIRIQIVDHSAHMAKREQEKR